MGRLLIRWFFLALSVAAASAITQALGMGFQADLSSFDSFLRLLVGVAVLSFLNATLGLILKVLTIPLSCLTLGIFSLVVNAFVLEIAASFHLGFRLTQQGAAGFWAAFAASIFISLINGALNSLLADDDNDRPARRFQ
jgi:putative membrane protein